MCAIWIQWPVLKRCAFLESHWIVHQVQINVAQSQFLTTLTGCLLHFLRFMVGVPQFGDNENVFTFHDAFFDFLLNCCSNLFFVRVQFGRIKVAIANVNCVLSSSAGFAEWLKSDKRTKFIIMTKIIIYLNVWMERVTRKVMANGNNFFYLWTGHKCLVNIR